MSFDTSLPLLLAHEGGYVNHPEDPGGATNFGVTQRVYNAYRVANGFSSRPVREITQTEVREIYREQYWDRVRGDDLPAGVAHCVFDYAVNSGVKKAIMDLQRVVEVEPDGVIGNLTLTAVRRKPPIYIIETLCARRLSFMRRLRHWKTFGRGWQRRVERVESEAFAMLLSGITPEPTPIPDVEEAPSQPANQSDVSASSVASQFSLKEVLSAFAGLIGAVFSAGAGDGPIGWAIAAVFVLAAIAGIWALLLRKERES